MMPDIHHPPALPDAGARQRALFDYESNLLVEAGAGSGKTALMAGRVALMLAYGIHPRDIVAITFTEAAASELLERIQGFVASLRDWPQTSRTGRRAANGSLRKPAHRHCKRSWNPRRDYLHNDSRLLPAAHKAIPDRGRYRSWSHHCRSRRCRSRLPGPYDGLAVDPLRSRARRQRPRADTANGEPRERRRFLRRTHCHRT